MSDWDEITGDGWYFDYFHGWYHLPTMIISIRNAITPIRERFDDLQAILAEERQENHRKRQLEQWRVKKGKRNNGQQPKRIR